MATIEEVRIELKVLENAFNNLRSDIQDDIKELKVTQKQLLEFMYQFQGGKAWLFSLLTISATVGALISGLIGTFSKFFVLAAK